MTNIFGFSSVWDPDYMLWYMRESVGRHLCVKHTRRASMEDEATAAPDDAEIGLNGGIYCGGGAPTTVEQHQCTLGSPAVASSSECIIPPWMAYPKVPGSDDEQPQQQQVGSSSAATTPRHR